jgi:penicillin amidase
VKAIGRESRYLKPYLLAALTAVPPSHPLAAPARSVLETWDGSAFADAVTSTSLDAGEVIFATWLSLMLTATFGDELGSRVGEAGANMLIHVLDQALTGESGVPPSRDYLNGVNPNAVMTAAFDQTLAVIAAAQGPNPSAWTGPRGAITFTHPLGTVASIPNSNRATYGQIVVLSRPHITAENIYTLGQSGFIGLVPPAGFALDPHFLDQLNLYQAFRYKPMRLYLNAQLTQ